MKKLVLILAVVLASGTVLHAQSRVYYPDSSWYYDHLIPELAIKWIGSQHFAHFPAHMLAIEHSLSDGLNLEHGAGLIYNRKFLEDDPVYFDNKGGFKSFTKVKLYLDDLDDPESFSTFIGFELFFNHLTYERTRTFELACGTDCSYFERRTFQMENNELGFRINAGLISRISARLYIEAEMALGMRHNNLTSNNRPADFLAMYGRIYPEEQSLGNYAFNMNLKLAYWIK